MPHLFHGKILHSHILYSFVGAFKLYKMSISTPGLGLFYVMSKIYFYRLSQTHTHKKGKNHCGDRDGISKHSDSLVNNNKFFQAG